MKIDKQTESQTAYNTYPNGGISCSKDSFVLNGSLTFQINFCGKSPAHRVAAKRYAQGVKTTLVIFTFVPTDKITVP